MKRWLHISEPCREDWAAMPGEAGRRFCAACGQQVHDLASLTEAEAGRLLAKATRERVCVRAEHDADGNIRFRATPRERGGATRAALRFAGGASLLLAGCGTAAEPSMEQGFEVGIAPAAVQATLQPSPSLPTPPSPPPSAPTVVAPPMPHATLGAAAIRMVPRARAPAATRATMGCACVPGDPLCSCL